MAAEDEISHDTQVTPAHVLGALNEFKREVNLRFDTVEGQLNDVSGEVGKVSDKVDNAGLNGHTPLLKSFLEQYGATYVKRQAWLTVWGDIMHRLRFLAPGKHWLSLTLAAIISAYVSAVFWGKLPDPLGFLHH